MISKFKKYNIFISSAVYILLTVFLLFSIFPKNIVYAEENSKGNGYIYPINYNSEEEMNARLNYESTSLPSATQNWEFNSPTVTPNTLINGEKRYELNFDLFLKRPSGNQHNINSYTNQNTIDSYIIDICRKNADGSVETCYRFNHQIIQDYVFDSYVSTKSQSTKFVYTNNDYYISAEENADLARTLATSTDSTTGYEKVSIKLTTDATYIEYFCRFYQTREINQYSWFIFKNWGTTLEQSKSTFKINTAIESPHTTVSAEAEEVYTTFNQINNDVLDDDDYTNDNDAYDYLGVSIPEGLTAAEFTESIINEFDALSIECQQVIILKYLENIANTPFARMIESEVEVTTDDHDIVTLEAISAAMNGKRFNVQGSNPEEIEYIGEIQQGSIIKGIYKIVYLTGSWLVAKTVDSKSDSIYLNINKNYYDKLHPFTVSSEYGGAVLSQGQYDYFLNEIKNAYPQVASLSDNELYGYFEYLCVPELLSLNTIARDIFGGETALSNVHELHATEMISNSAHDRLLEEYSYSWLTRAWNSAAGIVGGYNSTQYLLYTYGNNLAVVGEDGNADPNAQGGVIGNAADNVVNNVGDFLGSLFNNTVNVLPLILIVILLIFLFSKKGRK